VLVVAHAAADTCDSAADLLLFMEVKERRNHRGVAGQFGALISDYQVCYSISRISSEGGSLWACTGSHLHAFRAPLEPVSIIVRYHERRAVTLLVSMSHHRGAHCNLKISADIPYICYLPFTS
jgi:hypothetical protein